MRGLFPVEKLTSHSKKGVTREFKSKELDWKARVVCETCNNTWMSDLENNYAQPAITPLITGQRDIPIDLDKARSIGLFAFKTAVVLDQANSRSKEPFFEKPQRIAFKENFYVPGNVQMWLCVSAAGRNSGRFVTSYADLQLPLGNNLQMYVCTFAVGHLAVQIVSAKIDGFDGIEPSTDFEGLPIPFWPQLAPYYVWPNSRALRNRDDFMAFANRWKKVTIVWNL